MSGQVRIELLARYQLGVKYKFKQGEMDQVDNIHGYFEHDKYSRRIMANMYNLLI